MLTSIELQLGATNALIALAFFTIGGLITAGLFKERRLGFNALGTATALIFLTCATGHAIHAGHYVAAPIAHAQDSIVFYQTLADSVTLLAGISYLAQRRRHGLLIRGPHALLNFQRRLEVAEALRDSGQDIAAQTDLDSLLACLVRHATACLGADYTLVVAFDHFGLAHRHILGQRTAAWANADWPLAAFLAAANHDLNVAAGKPLVIDDLLAEQAPALGHHSPHRAEGARSLLAVPIARGGEVFGSLVVAYRRVRPVTEQHVSIAAVLAGQAAVALENVRLITHLRLTDRLKDEFLAAAAHEMKTPVTTISGWTQLLLRRDAHEPKEQRRALEIIFHQSQRMAHLTEDLLTAVRLTSGPPDLALKPERFDLAALARGIVEEAAGQADPTTAKHRFLLAANEAVAVEADRQLIQMVMNHLLENAVRYSPEGGDIEVSVECAGAGAQVSVRDHGVGISEERLPHAFEPFYEPVPAGQPGYVGVVSLGLYLSRQIVEAHGGRIWAASQPGAGSTFSFTLPLAD